MTLSVFHTIKTPAQDSRADHVTCVRTVKRQSVKVMRGQPIQSDFDLYFNQNTMVGPFYAPGLKGPPGASSNRIVRLSIRPSVYLFVCPFVCP